MIDIASLESFLYFGVKLAVLFALLLYIVFSVVLVRQEQMMAHVVEDAFQPILQVIVFVHMFASLGVFLLAVILL